MHLPTKFLRRYDPLTRCPLLPVAWRSRSPSVVLEVIPRHPAWDPLYVGAFCQRKGTDLTVGRLAILPSADTMSATILKRIGATVTEGNYFGSEDCGVQRTDKRVRSPADGLAQWFRGG